jgi:hypothetical protein
VPDDLPLKGTWPFDVFEIDWRSARAFDRLDTLMAQADRQGDVVVAALGPMQAVAGLFWANGCVCRSTGTLRWWIPAGVAWAASDVELTRACRVACAAAASVGVESPAEARALSQFAPDVQVNVVPQNDADAWSRWLAEPVPEHDRLGRVGDALYEMFHYPVRVDWLSLPAEHRFVFHGVADALCRIHSAGYPQCVLWGAGRHTRRLAYLEQGIQPDSPIQIVGVVDDDPSKRGQHVGPWRVYAAKELNTLGPAAVLVSSDAFEAAMWDRRDQFERMGIPVFCLYRRLQSRAEDLCDPSPAAGGKAVHEQAVV